MKGLGNKRQIYGVTHCKERHDVILSQFPGFLNACHYHVCLAYSPTKKICNRQRPQSCQKMTAKRRWHHLVFGSYTVATNGTWCLAAIATDGTWCLAASHRQLKPPGSTETAKRCWRHLVFSRRCKMFEQDCTALNIYILLGFTYVYQLKFKLN